MQIHRKLRRAARSQAGRYSVVGMGSNAAAVSSTIILAFLMPLPYASACAFLIGGQVTFWGNYLWTYRDHLKARLALILPLFVAMNYLLGWWVNRHAVAWCLTHFGLPDWWPLAALTIKVAAYIAAGLVTLAPNVAWNHYVIFRQTSDHPVRNRNENSA